MLRHHWRSPGGVQVLVMRTTTTLSVAALLVAAGVASARAQEQQQPQQQEQHARAETQPPIEEPRGQAEAGDSDELLTGRFVLAGSQEQAEARVNDAIGRAVAEMGFITRGVAADRLREKNPVRRTVETEVDGERITITYGDATYETRSGDWQTVTATGEQVQLLQTASGDSIYQTFRAPDGEKSTVYRFSPDGQRLTLDITLTSPRLPEPLRYSLQYRRAGGEQPVAAR
jgi:hypothetical protein